MDLLIGVEDLLKSVLDQQIQHEKNGEYDEAQKCRLKYEEQKQSLHRKNLNDMNNRHKQQQADLKAAWDQELESFNKFWDDKLNQFGQDSKAMEEDLKKKHWEEQEKTKEHLNATLPVKVKESSDLLNLRKMEEHMAKQKNYPEAKKIQTKVNQKLSEETKVWDANRKTKIDTTLNTLKNKQSNEMANFKKRVATSTAEKNRDRKNEEEKINLKYENFMRDLKKNQEKQVLAFKGQFKSLGGSGTASSSPTKTGGSTASFRKSP